MKKKLERKKSERNEYISELTLHILTVAVKALQRYDMDILIELGFEIEQLRKLRNLHISDLQYLSGTPHRFLSVELDCEAFDRMLDSVYSKKEEMELQDKLVLNFAPLPMMNYLYGFQPLEYSQRRKLLGLDNVGRPQKPTDNEQEYIWRIWLDNKHIEEPRRFLIVCEATKVPLNTIWSCIQNWEQDPSLAPILNMKPNNPQKSQSEESKQMSAY